MVEENNFGTAKKSREQNAYTDGVHKARNSLHYFETTDGLIWVMDNADARRLKNSIEDLLYEVLNYIIIWILIFIKYSELLISTCT